jgi:uncharacterized protein (DUF2235 family)
MKRIIICLDGTWNKVRNPAKVTNVVKLAQAVCPIASDGTVQVVYYNSGVGTGDLLDKILGGVFGRGLRDNVKRAYAFLSLNYAPGDEIYIFGFSRGSYTARALAGVIGACGILKKDHFEKFETAWNFYRRPPQKRSGVDRQNASQFGKQAGSGSVAVQKYVQMAAEDTFHTSARVRCVGVWDTVGSYGVPAGFGLGALSRLFTKWMRGFHNTHFGDTIDIGLHAVAIDEKRRPFAPTFWTMKKGETLPDKVHVEQVWFPGAHCNVGGSYLDDGLSSRAFRWMVARVNALGIAHFQSALEFDPEIIRNHSKPNSHGTLYRSEKWWPISSIFPYRRPLLPDSAIDVRAIIWNGEKPEEVHINESIHWSVCIRLQHGGIVDGKGECPYSIQLFKKPGRIRDCSVLPLIKIAQPTSPWDEEAGDILK